MVDKIDSNVTGLRFAEEVSLRVLSTFTAAIAATGVMTFGAAGSNAELIVIHSRTYKLVTAFSAGPTVANEVKIGANAAATAANLMAAINDTGDEGINYSVGTVIHPDVVATRNHAAVTVTSSTPGAAANAYATTTTMAAGNWSATTLTGGADVVGNPPVWYPLEPNSYSNFGGQIKTVARKPINPTRQRKKGVTTDLDASGGFNQDLTFDNSLRAMQGFMFASIHEKVTTTPMNGAAVQIASVTASTDIYAAASGLANILANDLIFANGFTNPANNGLKVAQVASSSTQLSVNDGTVDEASPPAAASLQRVGHSFASSTVDLVMFGGIATLSRVSGAFNFSTLGLTVGEWIFIGGDTSTRRFLNNQGWARISAITNTSLSFDVTSWSPVNEVGTSKTIYVFFGDFLRNEPAVTDIVRRTYQFERTLGNDADGTMSEYLVGSVANDFSLNVPHADKVSVDMSFVAIDNESYSGLAGVKAGTRVSLVEDDAYNTSVDVTMIKMSSVDPLNSFTTPLFGFATDMAIKIKNNAIPNKAIGVLGGFEVSVGTFEVTGTVTAYFASMDAVNAVRANGDISIHAFLVKNSSGMVFDLPLISLGDGRLNVQQDQAIMLPLTSDAAQSKTLGYTMLIGRFNYLPALANGN